ncbi:Dyp-type peroxidase [Nocardioides sp. LML1-1-1.1]|uniref:Dyp-type peroxidase n=1 Tax=Nocardioides sp. LML1-1-1.1 TaxID=3135248 RepID=UPI00341F8D57
MPAPTPQAVLAPLTESAIFLTFRLADGDDAGSQVRDLLADLGGLRRSVGFRIPEGDLTCVAGIGARAWDRIFDRPRPAGLHPFREVVGATHRAPATPGDLLLHIRAHRLDLCFELAQLVTGRLAGAAVVEDEVHGFRSFDQRDLLGFVDGTENPEGEERRAAVLVGDEDASYAGGSYVITQKYLHDLTAWKALSVEQQELAIGRSKADDIEMPDDRKPSNCHVALTTLVDADGTEHAIVRDNMPFGRVGAGEYGTYFIGYARDPAVTERMLRRMFVGEPAGNHDRVLDFSTAVTGNLYFVPPADLLDGAADPS